MLRITEIRSGFQTRTIDCIDRKDRQRDKETKQAFEDLFVEHFSAYRKDAHLAPKRDFWRSLALSNNRGAK